MESFLEDLYHGKILPAEHPWFPSPELRKKRQENDEAFEARLKAADPSLLKDFFTWQDIDADVIGGANKHMFIYGFRLGAQMMLEVLSQS